MAGTSPGGGQEATLTHAGESPIYLQKVCGRGTLKVYACILKMALSRWSVVILMLWGGIHPTHAWGDLNVHHCRFSSIHYEEPAHLERFAQRVQPSALTQSLNRIFMGDAKLTPEAQAGRYVDQLFQRVQSVLEMTKPGLKVSIKLLPNQSALSGEFEKITGRPTQSPAFYWKATNTIYLQLEQLSTGILAHEMAHAVMAHFFIIPPPEKILELLCQYVDREVRFNF